MNADQVIEGIGKAVAATQPVQEYCLFGFWGVTWWPVCMTKSEWSGWMQAIFSAVAILASSLLAVHLFNREKSKQRSLHLQSAVALAENLHVACNSAVYCQTEKYKTDLISLFEDSVDQSSALIHVDLPLEGRRAINGLRAISRLAFNFSKSPPDSGSAWEDSFRHWTDRSGEHLESLQRLLPESERKDVMPVVKSSSS
ncbi:hypothetical protein [Comamonas testosteroni]|uniref:hypothetical protein n=1 Tax=Comamonas testosteroni TaxID=285 RepID=UPI0028E4915C|nr:hypothetical protein [Comamonas testosteroni]